MPEKKGICLATYSRGSLPAQEQKVYRKNRKKSHLPGEKWEM